MNEKISNRIPLSALETGRTATVVAVAGSGALLRDTGDWFNDLWTDRPPMPKEKAFILAGCWRWD